MEKPQLTQWGFKDKDTFIRLYNQNIKLENIFHKKYNKWGNFIDVISSFPTFFAIIFIIYIIPDKGKLTPPILEDTIRMVGSLMIWFLLFFIWKYTFKPLSHKLYDIIINKRMKKESEKLLDVQVINYCNALKQYHEYISKLYGNSNPNQIYATFEYWEYNIIKGEKI